MKLKIIRDTLYFSSSRYVLLGLSVVRNLVVARVLGPEDYGLWIIATLVLTYGDQIHLGLRHAGDKEIPYYTGRSDIQQASRLASAIYAGVLVLSVIGVIGLTVVALATGVSSDLRDALLVCAMIVVSDQVSRFYLMILRTRKEFVLSSKVESWFELLRTTLVCGLAMLFHFMGALSAFLIASAATSLFFLMRYRGDIVPLLNPVALRQLFPAGFSLFLSGIMYLLVISLDRLIGASVLTKAELGIFGLASLLAQVPVNAAQAIKDVLYPTISEEFGREGSVGSVLPLFMKGLTIAAITLPSLVAVVYFVGEFLVRWLLPAFIESIPLMAILSNGIYFLCLAALPTGVLMATGRNRTYLMLQAITVVVTLIAYLLMVKLVGGAVALCYAASISFFVFAALVLSVLIGNPDRRVKDYFMELMKILGPSLYCMLLVAGLIFMLKIDQSHEFLSRVELTALRLLIFGVLYAPVVIVLERKMKLYDLVRKALKGDA
jgi:O-antigen/teichoic acid export membrane protein